LIKAIQLAQQEDAILIVAKLDRLGRTASNLFAIRDNVGEKLYICDKPNMSLLEFGMYATFAQEEREVISRRTKAALAARERKTGLRNGNKKGVNMRKAIDASLLERKDSAMNDEKNIVASNIIRLELQKGTSLQGIANYLNAIQLKTIKGKLYSKSTVQHLIKMFDLK
jgi:DNA invertase Pin-like site-specific DNA recombinase